ncbi:MAG TPA: FAD-binding oxidoreductase [Acidimicrobiales bacterium]|nr:FAD-binding oxidoreductase [Acidimicrobiales bacterium]
MRPGQATPPIEFEGGAAAAEEHFGGRRVEITPEWLERLRGACASLDTSPAATAEAGRDWWPLSLRWALEGATPARPAAVARPGNASEVAAVVALCSESGVPVTAAGGRSGVCGGSIPVFGGVLLDVCGLAGILGVDDDSLLVDVAAGTFGPDLERELRADHGLTVGHWPQSIDLATVGGWLACRGAGQYSTRYGKIEDMVAGLEVVLASAETIRTGAMAGAGPRSAMGPDLTQLFVGSEGTLGIITAARLRAHPVPPAEERAAYGFSSFGDGLEVLRRTLRRGATPAVVRLYDEPESKRSFDTATTVLIVLDEGDPAVIGAAMSVLGDECDSAGADRLDDGLVERWLEHRNDVSALAAVTRAGIVVDTIEISAPWSALAAIYSETISALEGIEGCLAATAHESHAYLDGACLYFTFAGRRPSGSATPGPPPEKVSDLVGMEASSDDGWGEAFYRRAWAAVLGVTRAHGGSISHHHGIGLVRAPYLPAALGGGFGVLASLKKALDPAGVLNPGKLAFESVFGPSPWSAEP